MRGIVMQYLGMRKSWEIRRVRQQYAPQGSWNFVHNNAHPPIANIVKQLMVKIGVVQIEHPPHSSDLNLPDFFLFPRLKLALKGKRFAGIPDVPRNVMRILKSIPIEGFMQSFQDLYSRALRGIVMGDDYFKGQ
ncbi:hypothetical protein TNCV_3790401 [Trichonephila clavipes]|nr:hypothetical protein TNCV_3790401 [Trichonephila clavipes]